MASGGDQFTLEADRYPGPKHAAVEFGPAVGLVGHHLAQLLADDIGNAGMQLVGRVGFDMNVVAQRAVGAVEEFDDAKAFVDGIEEGAVPLLAVGQRGLGAHQLAVVGGREGLELRVLGFECRNPAMQLFDINRHGYPPEGNRRNDGRLEDDFSTLATSG
ncbi:hypothetical protein QUH67_19620 [Bradyrhizobium roseum]|nr:hypothetical protein [Bradyrhizobium roseus]WKA25838.1 hypothetical protein QUH67_19620 [Bradyrhizobium roseus]